MYKKLILICYSFISISLTAIDLHNNDTMIRQYSKWEPFYKKKKNDLSLEEQMNPKFAQIINLKNLLQNTTNVQYKKINDSIKLDRLKFPLPSTIAWWAEDIIIPETFILSISHGCVYSQQGLVIIENNKLVEELIWEASALKRDALLNIQELPEIKKVSGKVAVITQAGCWNYYHWMVEVLPKLIFLQENNVKYDKIYLPLNLPYMQETIQLLGIDTNKIIQPFDDHKYIQADELIVPSFISRFGHTPQFAIKFLRDTFIPIAQQSVESSKLSKKIFISRRKASYRKIMNENEVFKLFEQEGFIRYDLEDLSILQQVMLFHNAETIIAEHGAGLINLIFCQPNTKVIEIFQIRDDATFWYLSQELELQHTCIKTIEFNKYAIDLDNIVPLQPIKDFIQKSSIF